MSKGRYVAVWNPSPATTTEEKAEAMQKAVETMMDGVRITCESTVITGNFRAGRDWDEFDDCIEPAKVRGLKLLIQFFPCGAREGAGGTGKWDCTDSQTLANFSADDLAAMVVLWRDVVRRVRDVHNLDIENGDVIFSMWNEPDQTDFGASAPGVFGEDHKNLFDAAAIGLKEEFPGMILAAPSFSYMSATDQRSMTWTAITTTNMGNPLRPIWRLCDLLDAHFYAGVEQMKPLGGVREQAQRTQLSFQNLLDQIAALPDHRHIVNLDWIASEQGKSYFQGGLMTTGWVYGDSEQRARITSAQLLQLFRNEKLILACTYLNQNVQAEDDYRDNEQNFGVHIDDGRATKLKQALARTGGAAIDDDLITAPEPVLTPP